jgi:hypothetical protein
MNKKVTVGAIGVAAMLTAHQPAHAQVYQDLRGQLMGFTGAGNLNTTITALGGIISSAIATNLTIGPGGSAPGQLFTFNTTGPADDSDLSALFPLPVIKITTGISLTLPTLTMSASFNRNTGVFAGRLFSPTVSTPPIPVSISGINITLTATFANPSASFIGQAGTPANRLSITNTGNESIWINPTVNSGLGQISLNNLQLYLTASTLTAVPGPEALAVFLPGMIGGLAMVRRRRRVVASSTVQTGSAGPLPQTDDTP